jgi:RNA polymerase sigma factor (sigma-70 family)
LRKTKGSNVTKRKIIYNNWIAENGVDPELPHTDGIEDEQFIDEQFISIDEVADSLIDPATSGDSTDDVAELRAEVRAAVAKLNEKEREFVERVYFMGMTIQELADKSGRSRHMLEAFHRRCRKKLIRHLSRFVEQHWGKPLRQRTTNCVICESIHRIEIDTLIAERDRTLTWKPVLKVIREKYGLKSVTVQRLRGHEQYH